MTNFDAAELIARCNRLGANLRAINYAGAQTSAKGMDVDPRVGRIERVGDLGTINEAGRAVLHLDRLCELANVHSGVDREDEMVAALDYELRGNGGATPSIDTAMYGLVGAEVDHLHPDSRIAFATAADGEALTLKAFGDGVVWVPWRRPGWPIGLDIAEIKEVNPAPIGCCIGGHGITAWGDTSAGAQANPLWIIKAAAICIAQSGRATPFGTALNGPAPLVSDVLPPPVPQPSPLPCAGATRWTVRRWVPSRIRRSYSTSSDAPSAPVLRPRHQLPGPFSVYQGRVNAPYGSDQPKIFVAFVLIRILVVIAHLNLQKFFEKELSADGIK